MSRERLPSFQHDLHVAANHLRMTKIHQLSSDDEAILLLRQFDLDIDLIRLSPVKHMSDATGSRRCSCQGRLRKAVVKQLDQAACSLPLGRQASRCERCLEDANSFRGRLVAGDRRRVEYSLPESLMETDSHAVGGISHE